ncbi:PREDICTED: CD209 antigen-like protein 2 isoform X2 [Cercocebus atys]|uniref:CD209 antigen-like protein 2 isoform X2 n=1 Tax=Cercocebus atys TaxID=9531 RepID=UPI0005F534C0|nr:PREDICTED: CD209 antigen-like protein 2 isoform X2 [Cercocebus atys]
MSDSKEPRAQPLGLLDFGFRQTRGYKSLAGCPGPAPLVLPLLFFTLFTGLLVAILVQVSKNPSSQRLEQSKQDEISQDLSQLKAAVDLEGWADTGIWTTSSEPSPDRPPATERLCRPCPWEWTFFQGNCYFISNSQRNWHDSITACQEVGAQLVVIKSAEEQNFLQLQSSRSNRFAWMGLSDLNQEDTWQWVDDSPLSTSFKQYWNRGEPNNIGEEDCAEFNGNGWNDDKCSAAKFWICKKSAASCSRDEGQLLSSASASPIAHAA